MNHCKTLACQNFELSDKKYYLLQPIRLVRRICRECGAFPPLLDNRALLEGFFEPSSRTRQTLLRVQIMIAPRLPNPC